MTSPTDRTSWVPAWAQAVSDYRVDGDEPGFDDVTVRMTLPAGFGGERVRIELSNRFGDEPVRIGRGALGVGTRTLELAFEGRGDVVIPVGESRWSDPVPLTVRRGDDLVVDLYLPDPTPYATAGGFRFDRSLPGDFAGVHPFPLEGSGQGPVDESREFPAVNTGPAPEPDGTGWSLPAGGPFLRTIEVAGTPATAVVVALGSSSTAMGWPQDAAALLPAESGTTVVNRGISGNRIRLDAPRSASSWGLAGLRRFDEDVLGTTGATHVVIAYNSNDWGLPGRVTSIDELPTVAQLVAGYAELVDRARAAGLQPVLATVTPLAPGFSTESEEFRDALNRWIRTAGLPLVDFDAALRSPADPTRLDPAYAAPDDTHPNVAGEKRLARELVDLLATLAR